MKKDIKNQLIPLSIGVLFLCFLFVLFTFAWTGPSGAPPDPNAPAPINIGSSGQEKEGQLGISIPSGEFLDGSYGLTVGTASNPLGIKSSGDSYFGQDLTAMGNITTSGNVETNQIQSWMGSDLILWAPGGMVGSADIYITPGIIGGVYRDVIMAENGGRVGIGTTAPAAKLDVSGYVRLGEGIADSWFPYTNNWAYVSGNGIIFREGSAEGYTERMRIDDVGNVGIGTTAPAAKLDVVGSIKADKSIGLEHSEAWYPRMSFNNPAAGKSWTLSTHTNGDFYLNTNDYVQAAQNTFYVWEHFSVTGSKNFEIPHPLDPNKNLVHSTLEGPEIAVFYRGTSQLKNGKADIELPGYFEALVRKEDRSILLTNIDGFDKLSIQTFKDGSQIKDGQFTVIAEKENSTQKFNWEVKALRADISPLQVEIPNSIHEMK